DGIGTLKIVVPYEPGLIGKTISCQSKLGGSSTYSNVASFKIKRPRDLRRALSKLTKLNRARDKRAEKCKSRWRANAKKYASKYEIPVCVQARESARELSLGRALRP